VRMASGTGSSPPPAHEEEQVLEGEDAFEIPSKNASQDHLRRWRVRRLPYYSSSVQIQRFLVRD
jgi:Ca2+-transporting ATPase